MASPTKVSRLSGKLSVKMKNSLLHSPQKVSDDGDTHTDEEEPAEVSLKSKRSDRKHKARNGSSHLKKSSHKRKVQDLTKFRFQLQSVSKLKVNKTKAHIPTCDASVRETGFVKDKETKHIHKKEDMEDHVQDHEDEADETSGGDSEDAEPLENSIEMQLSKEVKTEIKRLSEEAKNGTFPTPSQLKVFTIGALELFLRYNDRPSYNQTKPELAKMVADYIKDGCPPRCPKCQRGALRFSNGKKKNGKRYFWCPGSTRDGKHFYNCNFKAQRQELDRIPWKCP